MLNVMWKSHRDVVIETAWVLLGWAVFTVVDGVFVYGFMRAAAHG